MDHNGNKQDLSVFCAILDYNVMFNIESLHCIILLNEMKSNQIKDIIKNHSQAITCGHSRAVQMSVIASIPIRHRFSRL